MGVEYSELALRGWFSVSPFLSASSFLKLPVEKNHDLSLQKTAKSCLGHDLQITLFKTLICDINDCKTLKMTLLKAHFILMHSVPF